MESKSLVNIVHDSIVKIYNDYETVHYSKPWKKLKSSSCTGTGFCIEFREKKYIITNSHVVENSVLLEVQKYGNDTHYYAEVVFNMPESDLAILDVDEDNFWNDLIPLKFTDDFPKILQTVYVVGYPMGGVNISFTKGVVSRIIDTMYCDVSHNVCIQIDAAINGGNSGGPVVNIVGQVVGVAFQGFNKAENMGLIIPVFVVKNLFLKYFEKYLDEGQPESFSTKTKESGVNIQPIKNDSQKKFYGLSKEQTGIIVNNIWPTSSLKDILQKDDVILEIDGNKITSDGNVKFFADPKILVPSNYLITNKNDSDTFDFKIMRDKKEIDLKVEIKPPKNVYNDLFSKDVKYMIIGGLVFVVLNREYHNQNKKKISKYIDAYLDNSDLDRPYRENIILSDILSHKINMGYDYYHFNDYPLSKFCGKEVINMKHLSELYDKCQDEFLVFEFSNLMDDTTKKIMLSREDVLKGNKQILSRHKINSDRSID